MGRSRGTGAWSWIRGTASRKLRPCEGVSCGSDGLCKLLHGVGQPASLSGWPATDDRAGPLSARARTIRAYEASARTLGIREDGIRFAQQPAEITRGVYAESSPTRVDVPPGALPRAQADGTLTTVVCPDAARSR